MIGLQFEGSGFQRILCLGAHADDIEIGCGGTLLKLLDGGGVKAVSWVVFAATDTTRRLEAMESAEVLLRSVAEHDVVVCSFRDGYLPFEGAAVKDTFEELKRRVSPDLVFTHHREDRHQDHRMIAELTWNTFRDHVILEYEIPKYDGDLGAPNVFVHLDEGICQAKIGHLLGRFRSQVHRRWFSEEVFRSLLRLRGMESNSPSGYAEAFYCRKLVVA